jgi:hypothetical protein
MLSGVSRTLDLGGLYDEYNSSPDGNIADMRALASDWMVVQNDVANAILEVLSEQERLNVQSK